VSLGPRAPEFKLRLPAFDHCAASSHQAGPKPRGATIWGTPSLGAPPHHWLRLGPYVAFGLASPMDADVPCCMEWKLDGGHRRGHLTNAPDEGHFDLSLQTRCFPWGHWVGGYPRSASSAIIRRKTENHGPHKRALDDVRGVVGIEAWNVHNAHISVGWYAARSRANCNFIVPSSIPYKYPMGCSKGWCIAIYSWVYCHSVPSHST
jgi:hypothetical protein